MSPVAGDGAELKGYRVKNRLTQFFNSLSLRTLLILLALLLALPTVLLIIHSGATQRNEAIRKGFGEVRRVVNNIAKEQYNLTGDVEQLLVTLAQTHEIRKHDVAATNAMLASILKKSPHFNNIVVTDQSGTVWASALPLPNHPITLEGRRSLKNAIKSRTFSSGEYVIGSISGKATIGFGYPMIYESGILEGVIAANIRFDTYEPLLNPIDIPKGITLDIVDRNGIILHRYPDTDNVVGVKMSDESLTRMSGGPVRDTYVEADKNGDRIVSYRAMRLAGEQSAYMFIRASLPTKGALDKARHAELINIAILSPLLLISIMMAIPIANRCFIKRIHMLRDAAHRLAAGDLQIRVAESVSGGELGELAQAFDDMARQLAERENALYKKQRDLDDLYNNAPCGYHSMDSSGLLIRINDTELSWLGYRREEVVGVLYFSQLLTTDSQQAFDTRFSHLKD